MELNISIIITAIAGRMRITFNQCLVYMVDAVFRHMHCNVVQLKLIKLNSSINNARNAANTWDESGHITYNFRNKCILTITSVTRKPCEVARRYTMLIIQLFI